MGKVLIHPEHKRKNYARINSVRMGGGPHGGNIGPHKCKGCDTIIRTRECPFCWEGK